MRKGFLEINLDESIKKPEKTDYYTLLKKKIDADLANQPNKQPSK